MEMEGGSVRFCQQCGRFQAIEEFDGLKKTCRRKLNMHNAQRKRKRDQKHELPEQRNHSDSTSLYSEEEPGTPFQCDVSPNGTYITTRTKLKLSMKENAKGEQSKQLDNRSSRDLPSGGPATATGVPVAQMGLEKDLLDGINIDALFSTFENNCVGHTGGSIVSQSKAPVAAVELPDRLPSMQLTTDYGRFAATTWVPQISRDLSFSESSELCNAGLSPFHMTPADPPADTRSVLEAFDDPGYGSSYYFTDSAGQSQL